MFCVKIKTAIYNRHLSVSIQKTYQPTCLLVTWIVWRRMKTSNIIRAGIKIRNEVVWKSSFVSQSIKYHRLRRKKIAVYFYRWIVFVFIYANPVLFHLQKFSPILLMFSLLFFRFAAFFVCTNIKCVRSAYNVDEQITFTLNLCKNFRFFFAFRRKTRRFAWNYVAL